MHNTRIEFTNIPQQLKEIPRWVNWKSISRKGKPTKVPFQPNGLPASHSNPDTWSSFEEVTDGYLYDPHDKDFTGVGFVFSSDDDIIGIDLDDCIDPDGNWSDLATEFVESVNGYAEITPSGEGLHIITRSSELTRSHKDDAQGIEIYNTNRYFTFTGHVLNGHTALTNGNVLPLIDKYFSRSTPNSSSPIEFNYKPPVDFDDDQIIATLKYIDPDEGYNTWLNTGIALHHQYDGSHQGLNIWSTWSQRSAHYNLTEINEKWSTFGNNSTRGEILTFASIVSMAKKTRNKLKTQQAAVEQSHTLIASPPRDLDLFNIDLPPMEWIIGHRLQTKYVTATFAPGGVSKSTFSMVTAVAIASGRSDITGESVQQSTVWIINNEDDEDILLKRLAAIAIFHKVPWATIQSNIRITSGYSSPFKVDVTDKNGNHFNVDKIISEIHQHNISLLIVDPFISTHSSEENSNEAIQAIVDQFKHIAAETKCAIELIHHTRKGTSGANSEAYAGEADAGRGASSLKDAARIVQTLAKMSPQTAETYNIQPDEARRLVRLDMGKGNFSLPDAQTSWFRLASVDLSNGDSMGVHETFDLTPLVEQAQRDKDAKKDEQITQYRQDVFEKALELGADEKVIRLSTALPRLMSIWKCSRSTAYERTPRCFEFGKENALTMENIHGKKYRVWYQSGEGKSSPIEVFMEGVE